MMGNMPGMGMMGGMAWTVNGEPMADHGHAHEPVLKLGLGRSHVLDLVNETQWHHPIHLHGHTFRVITRDGKPARHREWLDTLLMPPRTRAEIACRRQPRHLGDPLPYSRAPACGNDGRDPRYLTTANGEPLMQATEVKGPVELPATAAEQTETPAAEEPPPAAHAEAAACCGVQSGKTSSRPWLIGAALLGIPLALWGGWDWLAATGLATILIGVAPCLAMCALGLCMGRGKKVGLSLTDIRKTYETQSGEPPSRG